MTQAADPIRVMLVHARPIYRDALALLLSRDPHFNVVAHGAADGVTEQVRRNAPDVLLIDAFAEGPVVWPHVLRDLRSSDVAVSTILLGEEPQPARLFEAVELGVRGILPNDASTDTLKKCLRCVAAGEYWIGRERTADVLDYMRRRADNNRQQAEVDQFGLTVREKEVIRTILGGFTNKEIAAQLAISGQTVKHHLGSIYAKLGVSNRLELALFAWESGLLAPNALSAATTRK